MKEMKGNVFDLAMEPGVDSICITTNGITNYNGLAMMGAGTAGEAARRWPNVRFNLGKALKAFGNLPFVIGYLDDQGTFNDPNKKVIASKQYKSLIWSFPTKGDFRLNAQMDLIKRSSQLMSEMATSLKLTNVMIPRPGCGKGTGKLIWKDVKAEIEPLLDDRFTVTYLDGEEE